MPSPYEQDPSGGFANPASHPPGPAGPAMIGSQTAHNQAAAWLRRAALQRAAQTAQGDVKAFYGAAAPLFTPGSVAATTLPMPANPGPIVDVSTKPFYGAQGNAGFTPQAAPPSSWWLRSQLGF